MLLGFDYDGTLAPLVSRPDQAAMPEGTARRLRALARRYPCVIVSGRSCRDLRRRVRGSGIRWLVGNHGVEPWHATARTSALVRGWRARLGELGPWCPGVTLEDKTYSLAVHYRQSANRPVSRRRILAAAGRLPRARIVPGKLVVNLVPEGAPHKGEALDRVRRRTGCVRSLYVGDDVTDDDVFAGRDRPVLGIQVGRRRGCPARWFLERQAEVDGLLDLLLSLRAG